MDFSQPLGDECIPLNIPGLGAAVGTSTSTADSPGATTKPTTCSPPGKTGICQSTSKTCAGGSYISGYCPGDNSIKCCPDASTKPTTTETSSATPTTCKPPGKTGICQDTSTACSGGAYISGYCPGDNSIKCCPNTASGSAPTTCKPPGKTGVCQKTSIDCAGGEYISGYCPGDNSIKCCPDAPAPTATAGSGGGGGCKMKRDRLGRRMLIC